MIGRVREYLTVGCNTKLIYVVVFFLIYATFVGNPNLLGFYEDDYFQIVPNLNGFEAESLGNLRSHISSFPQGRPIGFAVPVTMAMLSKYLGGKVFLYSVLALIHFLIFVTARNIFKLIFKNDFYSLYGGLFTVFFVADTTHSLLIHAFQVHLSLLFSLIGILLYQKRTINFSYIFLIMSALCYESSILLFIFFPLVLTRSKEELCVHFLKSSLIMLVVLILRKYFFENEERVVYLFQEPLKIAENILSSVFWGPITSIKTSLLFVREIEWIKLIEDYPRTILVVLLNSVIFYISKKDVENESFNVSKYNIIAGVIIFGATYLLNISHDPTRTIGRLTSVHLNACIMIAYLSITFWVILIQVLSKWRILIFAQLLMMTFYHFNIQQSYVSSWSKQKEAWHRIINKIANVTEKESVYIINNWYEAYQPKAYTLQGPHLVHVMLDHHFRNDKDKPLFLDGTMKDIKDKFRLEKDQSDNWVLIDKANYGYIDHYLKRSVDINKIFTINVKPYEKVVIKRLDQNLDEIGEFRQLSTNTNTDFKKLLDFFSN